MNIDEAYNFVLDIVHKNQNGQIKPVTFNRFAKMAQQEEYETLLPTFESTQKLIKDLSPFIVKKTISIDAQGKGNKPSDFYYIANALKKSYINPLHCGTKGTTITNGVDFVDVNQLSDRLGSNIDGIRPNLYYPIAVEFDSYFEFYPTNLGQAELWYLRKPIDPKWAFTIQSGRAVYDSANSVNFEFPETKHLKICARIISYVGINLRETSLSQYAGMLEQKLPQ